MGLLTKGLKSAEIVNRGHLEIEVAQRAWSLASRMTKHASNSSTAGSGGRIKIGLGLRIRYWVERHRLSSCGRT